jgi:hypothetical protein
MEANIGHLAFNASWKKTWDERLHRIEETVVDELGLSKYRCICFYCCGGGRLVLMSTIRAHL